MTSTEQAFSKCQALASSHYENFPVASILLPSSLRRPVAAIYAFARTADDIADEHDWDDSTRVALLAEYRIHLDQLQRGARPVLPLFMALNEAIREHHLPFAPFYDLLDAFAQDVHKKRYANFAEVHDYCRRSANPVGHLLLSLFKNDTEQNLKRSDAICTALQLINFLQDIQIDLKRGRIYLPEDEMQVFNVTERHIVDRIADHGWHALINAQIDRIDAFIREGKALGSALAGRMGFEIRLTIAGGTAVLAKLRRTNEQGFIGGERLDVRDWLRLVPRALLGSGT